MTTPSDVDSPSMEARWEKRVSLIFDNIDKDEAEHQEIASAASHIAVDYEGRFLIELVQNATDQVKNANRKTSTIVVVRTREYLALLNEGVPFTKKGFNSVTRLALSPKNAEQNLGNKGVGFKSVFEVTNAPEIYSARNESSGLRAPLGYAFSLDRTPLERPEVQAKFSALVARLLVDRPVTRQVLAERGKSDLVEAALEEIGTAAGWKFPLPRGPEELEKRAASLGLRDEWLEAMQTLVVLPLIANAETTRTVDRALDEIRSETSLLFLPRVNEIILVDQVARTTTRVLKTRIRMVQALPSGATVDEWETAVGPLDAEPTARRRWWIAARTVGSEDGIGPAGADAERDAIRAAAEKLPGKGWKDVKQATVSVAVPLPQAGTFVFAPERGTFCIGLPTRVETGTAMWVDAHFHGSIARTEIKLDIPYNKLLVDEATRLSLTLLETLKNASTVDIRRAVTLLMEWSGGPLAMRLREAKLRTSAIILAADGATFFPPSELAPPRAADAAMFARLTAGDEDGAREAGFVLPEPLLLEKRRPLLSELTPSGKRTDKSSHDGRFLVRLGDGRSLIERGARRHRTAGANFWEPFLAWALDTFAAEDLEEQAFLPVGTDQLAAPKDRIFLEPVPQALGAHDDEEVGAAEMPSEVRQLLRFLDGAAFQVRMPEQKNLTPLAARLSPSRGRAFVSPARRDEILKHAVAPLLTELAADPAKQHVALELLAYAVSLAQRLGASADVPLVLVPTTAREGGGFRWASATTLYFGAGWLDDPTIEADLEAAYGHREDGLLLAWSELASTLALDDYRRAAWRRGLEALGVARRPRLFRRDHVRAFNARAYDRLTPMKDVPCPWDAAAPFWDDYITQLAVRASATKSNHVFEIARVSWLDGLEDPRARAAVLRRVLAEAETYGPDVLTATQRTELQNAVEVPSLWAFALQKHLWPVIPVEGPTGSSVASIADAWWLTSDERSQDGAKLLPAPPRRFADAELFLRRLGIVSLPDAGSARIVRGLQQISSLPAEVLEQRAMAVHAIVGQLWERLRARCVGARAGGTTLNLSALLTRPIPLLRGKTVEVVDLRAGGYVYLNDDPVRGAFVPGLVSALQLPLLRDAKPLVADLRAALGAQRVITTSDAPVVTRFTPAPDVAPLRFLDLTGDAFPETDVAVDLALLRVHGESHDRLDPQKPEFAAFWTALDRLVVQRGTFAQQGGTATRAYYAHEEGELQIARDAAPHEIVEESWPLATTSHRSIWTAYAAALEKGRDDAFFLARSIGDNDRAAIQIVTRRTRSMRLGPLKSAIFAAAHAKQQTEPEAFEREWPEHGVSPTGVANWIAPSLENAILRALEETTEELANLAFLGVLGLTVPAWQAARQLLGLAPWRFEASRQAFVERRDELAAALRSESARFPTIDLSAARSALESIAKLVPDDVVLSCLLDDDAAWDAVVAGAGSVMHAHARRDAMLLLVERVDTLTTSSGDARRSQLDKLGSMRERSIYLRDPESVRSAQASNDGDELLRVAAELAAKHDETVDRPSVLANERVKLLVEGWWANRWAMLAALKRVLQGTAPITTRALSDADAFREHFPFGVLWEKFPELGPVPLTQMQQATARKVKLFGSDSSSDAIAADLSAGPTGDIGRKLQGFVNETLDLGALAAKGRPILPAAPEHSGRRGKHRRGGGNGDESRADRDLNGQLGEAFVYAQLGRVLESFDEHAWRSENRAKFGFEANKAEKEGENGSDGLGYDFRYLDVKGVLSGRPGTECWIEVKSTSQLATEAFPITMAEWERAEECHKGDGAICYVIVRVVDVRGTPRIADVIRDPYGLWKTKQLRVSAKDLWLRVG